MKLRRYYPLVRLRVLEILSEQNHTKYWLFNQMNTSYTTFHKMINNQTKSIHYETLDKLSTVLGCSVGDLFEKVPNDSE